jgi:DNA-directed RNA polymerase subunit alpha
MTSTRILMPESAKTQTTEDRLDLSLTDTGIELRTANILEMRGIFTVADLLNRTPEQLLEVPNLGEKTLETIYAALEKVGYYRRKLTESNPAAR